MPPFSRGFWRTMPVACLAGALCLPPASAGPRPTARRPAQPALTEFERAEQDRRELEAIAENARSEAQYERVLNEYRAIYHAHPAAAHADASVAAVAELLAAEGRSLHRPKSSRDAIAQYEFLRREYPGSRLRIAGLMREGEIFANDLDDREAARTTFQQFLHLYPHSTLARQVQSDLSALATPVLPEKSPAGAERARARVEVPAGNGKPPARRGPQVVSAPAVQASAPTLSAKNSATSPLATPPLIVPRDSATLREAAPSGAPSPVTAKGPAAATPARSPATAEAKVEAAPPTTDLPPAKPEALPGKAEPPPARPGRLTRVTGIRHWSTAGYTRVAIDLENEVEFEAGRVTDPDRIFFDLHGTRLATELKGKAFDVQDDGFLSRIRVAQFSNEMTRVVLNVSNISDYSAFLLPNPYRLIIDVHGRPGKPAESVAAATAPEKKSTAGQSAVAAPAAQPVLTVAPPVKLTRAQRNGTTRTHEDPTADDSQQNAVASVSQQPGSVLAKRRPTSAPVVVKNPDGQQQDELAASGYPPQAGLPVPTAARTAGHASKTAVTIAAPAGTAGDELQQISVPVKPPAAPPAATSSGKPSPLVAANSRAASRSRGEPSPADDGNDASAMTRVPDPRPAAPAARVAVRADDAAVPDPAPKARPPQPAVAEPLRTGAHEAAPTSGGERSLVRALGLKIGRIVVDAGHGGHDSGTLGVDGIQEKDVVLDVALRLGKLLKQRLGSDVIYTRDSDTFIPLETRTAIANKAQADLFISVHANSSQDPSARGVEVYYLNFTASPDALEVAARENAVSQNSIFQLSSLVKQITLRDKIEESHEFASDVDASLFNGISVGNAGLKDRGVKKAPFVVLIGANMPSILAEISFVTNAEDARQLRDPNYRQRIAESLYRGVAKYANGLSGVRLAQTGRAGTNGR